MVFADLDFDICRDYSCIYVVKSTVIVLACLILSALCCFNLSPSAENSW